MKRLFLILIIFLCFSMVVNATTIKFNPTGTHIKDGLLKIRLDFYPDVNSKTYIEQYIDVFARELTKEESEVDKEGNYTKRALELQKLVPTVKQLNPFLCLFIVVDPNITKAQLLTYIQNNYGKAVITELDTAIKDGIKTALPTILKNKVSITSQAIATKETDIEKVNASLLGFEVEVK